MVVAADGCMPPSPLGRWVRLLLLCAGDVERNPGPIPIPTPISGVRAIIVKWSDGRTSRIRPKQISTTHVCVATDVRWGKSNRTYPVRIRDRGT